MRLCSASKENFSRASTSLPSLTTLCPGQNHSHLDIDLKLSQILPGLHSSLFASRGRDNSPQIFALLNPCRSIELCSHGKQRLLALGTLVLAFTTRPDCRGELILGGSSWLDWGKLSSSAINSPPLHVRWVICGRGLAAAPAAQTGH